MGKKRLRRRKSSLEQIIKEHQEKIKLERQKNNPDEGIIKHWEKEIAGFEKSLKTAKRRLGEKT